MGAGHVKGGWLPAAWFTGPGRPNLIICSFICMCVVELLHMAMFKPALPKCPARQSLALRRPPTYPVLPAAEAVGMYNHASSVSPWEGTITTVRSYSGVDRGPAGRKGPCIRGHLRLCRNQGSTGLAECIWS